MAKKTKKKRTRRPITTKEASVIRTMTKQGATMRQIAKRLRRAPSTIWRWQQR